jgi:hypothetical protein
VSTVLEAVRQQQRNPAGVPDRGPIPKVGPWRPPWQVAAVIAVALAVVLIVVVPRPESRPAGGPVTSTSAPHVQAPAARAVPPAAPPAVHSLATGELPRGRITDRVLPSRRPNAVPKVKRAPETSSQAEAPSTVGRVAAPPSRPSNSGVRVDSIHYTESATKRTVTLLIGTDVVTLHEGESAGGVEVQLILPDVVYIRNGGSIYAIAGSH